MSLSHTRSDLKPGGSAEECKRVFTVERAIRGLTYADVAKLIGYSEANVEALANGRFKPGRASRLIEIAFGVPVFTTRKQFEAANRASLLLGWDVGLVCTEGAVLADAIKRGLLPRDTTGTKEEVIALLAKLPKETPVAPPLALGTSSISEADWDSLFPEGATMQITPELRAGVQRYREHVESLRRPQNANASAPAAH